MNATSIRNQAGRFLLAVSLVGAVLGVGVMMAAPASAHADTTIAPCVPSAGQPYIAPTYETQANPDYQPATYEYKYDKDKWNWKRSVADGDKVEGNVGASDYGSWESDGQTGWGGQRVVGTPVWSGNKWYLYSDEQTRVDDEAEGTPTIQVMTDPGQPYIAPVVCDTTNPGNHTIVFWAIPAGGGHTAGTAFDGGAQSFFSYGTWGPPPTSNTTLQCGVWYQVDRYLTDTGTRTARLAAIVSDGMLTYGEDWNGGSSADDLFNPANSTQWTFVYGGDCAPPPVDVCENIAGVQETVPAGMILDGVNCVTPPVDVCENIAGVQETVPAGLIQDGVNCVSPPVDVCENIAGNQETVPAGMILDGVNCVTPPVDVCENIAGVQETVPAGLIPDGANCVSPPVDVCANIAGNQETVPAGMILVDGSCLTEDTQGVVDVCANIAGVQETLPAGLIQDGANCVTPPVDVCANIAGNQETVPAGMILVDGSCFTEETQGVVDACTNIDGIQETIPVGYSLVQGICVKDSTTPTLTEVVLAATGADGTTGRVALALSLTLGGLGAMLLRRRVGAED